MSQHVARFALALIVIALLASAVVIMSFVVVPDSNREVIVQLIGNVGTLAGLVIGYYFGSTAKHDDQKPDLAEYTEANPMPTKVVNHPEQPVPVEPAGD